MPLQMSRQDNGRIRLQFENRVSVWNILKFLSETPYLKHFIVENYEGGNTLVPREIWTDEGIMFREMKPGVFLFPYDSIGFILDDSVHNLKLTIVEPASESNYQTEYHLIYSVHNTDETSVVVNEEQTGTLIALYLLSTMKIGFDRPLLERLSTLFRGMKFKTLEYIPASLVFGVKESYFLLKISADNETRVMMVTYDDKSARKDMVKEDEIKNIGMMRNRILSYNKYIPMVYYGVLGLASVLLIVFNKKLFLLITAGLFIVSFIYTLIKKNAYKARKTR